jgi:hypothetical protein
MGRRAKEAGVFVRIVGAAIGLICVNAAAVVSAQQPLAANRPYDGIQAGVDAYRLAEEKRQAGVSQQLFLNDQMRFWNGYPTSSGQTIYYGNSSPYYGYGNVGYGNYGYATPLLNRANLDYTYAYGAGPAVGGYGPGWGGPLAVFQPWPYVPGNIYGYPAYYQPARQPIGQQQTQTGPNRWESHPVYDPPLTPYRPLPPVDSPLLSGTPFASPQEGLPPAEAIPPPPPPADPVVNPAAVQPVPPGPAAPTPPRRGPREY